MLLGVETHGKAMGIGDGDPAARFCVAPPPVIPAPTNSAAARTVLNPAENEHTRSAPTRTEMPMSITGEQLPRKTLLGVRLLIKKGSDGHPANRPGAITVAEAAAARRNQVPRGIAYMAGSTAMFAGGNAVVKWQLATYPLGEVAFGRTLFALLTVAAIVLPRSGWSVLRTRRYREHLQRGLSQFGSMLCWFLAVSVLSLGSAPNDGTGKKVTTPH